MSKLLHSRVLAVTAAAGILVGVGGAGGAYASRMITGADIKNGTVHGGDVANGSLGLRDLNDFTVTRINQPGPKGDKGDQGPKGDKGEPGPTGPSGLEGAYYSVAFYDVGDTNAGAIATVACKDQGDVAISGGVQTVALHTAASGAADNSYNTPVSSSFPGRMDWSTNTPKPDRLDGWVVQFGGNAGAASDKAPEKVKVWALCVPGAHVPVEQTYTESSD